jgi:hypothetical protein
VGDPYPDPSPRVKKEEKMRQTKVMPVVESTAAVVEEKKTPEQRLAAMEQRLSSLEMQAHTEHNIGSDTLEVIATHVLRRLAEHVQQTLGQAGTSQESKAE